MKRQRVTAYQVALVFKNGEYKRMLTAGSHWLGWGEKVRLYDITKPFYAPLDLNILLKDEALADILHVIEVKDNEIVMQYQDGFLTEVLTAGRYTYWKTLIPYTFVRADISQIDIAEDIDRATLTNKLVAPYVRTVSVESYEKALLFVDGKYVKLLDSGVYFWWKNSIAVHVARVDTRLIQLEISGQEILTKDKTGLRINAMAQYKVSDPEKAVLQNKEYDKQLYIIFQLALREYIGTFSLDEILEKKETIAPFVLQGVKENAASLGVEVTGFGIRDIILPGDVKDILNQVLIAEKRAQANIITRREETASTRSLLNTAKLMEENAMLWKLKEMEYVEKIADKINSISVSGNGVLIDQLKQIFTPAAKSE